MTAAELYTLKLRRPACVLAAIALSTALWAATSAAQQPPMPNVRGWQAVPNIQLAGGSGGVFQIVQHATGSEYIGPINTNRKVGFAARSGASLTVDATWPARYGYRPIVFRIRVRTPAAFDRAVRIQFHAGSWQTRGRGINVDQTFTLPAGRSSLDASLLTPQYSQWDSCGWDIAFDGEYDAELRLDGATNPQLNSNPGITALMSGSGGSSSRVLETQVGLQLVAGGAVSLLSRPVGDWPADWLPYSSLDLVIMPTDDMRTLAANHPQQATALFRWLRSGGTLWIIEAGQNWDKLAALDDIWPSRSPETPYLKTLDDENLPRGWRTAPVSDRAVEPLEGALVLSPFNTGESTARTTAARVLRATRAGLGVPANLFDNSGRHFLVRSVGLGVVAAFPGALPQGDVDNPEDQTGAIQAITRSLLGPRLNNHTRLGHAPDAPNLEFNNWLIPGVGMAPVTQFQVLLSLFVLGIGPLNYWWFKKRRKLPLLLVTTPIAAITVTALLLAYGLLGDGLGTRVRARTLTLLDQRTREATSWSRLTYYAGMTPKDGLRLPKHTAVFPIAPDWSAGRRSRRDAVERFVRWRDDQWLRGGWLPPRTPTQYLTISARQSSRRLDLRTNGEDLRVVNRLGVGVQMAIIQDHQGRMYLCESLAPDAQLVVKATTRTEVSPLLRRVFSDNFPEFPAGAEKDFRTDYGLVLSKNLMEAQIEAINSPLVQDFGDGSYIAVTDRGVDLELGIEGAREEASFHVIQGSW